MRLKRLLKYAALLALCTICYFDTLRGDYVFDDTVAIVKNNDVTNPAASLYEIFTHDFWGYNITDPTSHKSYRPLTILMFHYERNVLGFGSYEMKLVNFLIHCLNTCLVFKFYNALTSVRSISFVGAVIFAVHPVHTEAICGVVGRAELMFCLCYLLALILFSEISFGKRSNVALIPVYVMIVALAVVGLLFKENAITILPALIAFDVTIRTDLLRNIEARFRVRRVVFSRFGILTTLTALLLVGRLYIQEFESPKFKPMDNPIAASSNFVTKILSQNFLYTLNAWILLCPDWLSFDWALGCVKLMESFLDSRILGVFALYLIFHSLMIKGSRLVLLSLALLIVPFLPACGFIRVGFVIAERILYVPSIGISLLVAVGFSTLVERYYKLKYVLGFLLVALVCIYILRTRHRAGEWTSEEKLFSSALRVCPENAKVHYNIAKVAADKGQNKKAFKHYHNAIRLYPKYESALMNLGNLYRNIGDLDTAEKYLKESIEVLEEFPAAWMNLGIVQTAQHKYDDALESYHTALQYRPRYSTCLYNLGNLYLDTKNYSMALKYWQESVAINPTQGKAWANMLNLLDNKALYEDVLLVSERALKYVPTDTNVLFIRANVLGKLKKYIEAEQVYQRILELNPKYALYHVNLGVLYHRWGKRDLAVASYRNALKIDPSLKSAKDNLQKLIMYPNSNN
ncbi:unnamed protein product [Hermetia illucens]|uniref:dolichyl-phosphate-mannose--protein mannosyltransferase n=1 Tax=Hermetia illucens TaxID=343691 RepID=A0A7R8V5F4_HERIL|nr:protein O-mannosyl-transferase TMTC4 [Hermetia illucens]CAD7092475.1 unnamed protein product [Hermetia illucens]